MHCFTEPRDHPKSVKLTLLNLCIVKLASQNAWAITESRDRCSSQTSATRRSQTSFWKVSVMGTRPRRQIWRRLAMLSSHEISRAVEVLNGRLPIMRTRGGRSTLASIRAVDTWFSFGATSLTPEPQVSGWCMLVAWNMSPVFTFRMSYGKNRPECRGWIKVDTNTIQRVLKLSLLSIRAQPTYAPINVHPYTHFKSRKAQFF